MRKCRSNEEETEGEGGLAIRTEERQTGGTNERKKRVKGRKEIRKT